MAGTKRTSGGDDVDTRTRKVARVCDEEKQPRSGDKGKNKTKAVPRSMFQSQALPIHVNFTHTPAAVIENEGEQTTPSDPGHIGSITMLPAEFSTGSYGWKGARRITIELQGAKGEEREKALVMINVNATVVGSKGAVDEGKNTSEEKGAGDSVISNERPKDAEGVWGGIEGY